MFWKSKNNNKKKVHQENMTLFSMNKRSEERWGYVEIYDLTQRLSHLNQLTNRIDDLLVAKGGDAALHDYQVSLRAAYIFEFERDYEEIFFKPTSYDDFRKTRSTL